jgi:hypothetical protein
MPNRYAAGSGAQAEALREQQQHQKGQTYGIVKRRVFRDPLALARANYGSQSRIGAEEQS